jgi:hypothetical protein
MLRNTLIALGVAVTLSAGASTIASAQVAAPARSGDVRRDTRDIRSDRRDLRGDRHDIGSDKRDLRSDNRDRRADRRELRRDRANGKYGKARSDR